jgi:hypothetical protein
MSDLSDAPEMPAADAATMPSWFDAEKHRAGEGGIFETATGVLLGEDGAPFSAAVRLSRGEAAAAAAADPAKPPKKPRGTEATLAAHINASAAAGEKE